MHTSMMRFFLLLTNVPMDKAQYMYDVCVMQERVRCLLACLHDACTHDACTHDAFIHDEFYEAFLHETH